MDLAAPPAGANPTPLPDPTEHGAPPTEPGSPRIVAGVAALIGDRLGIDPLWVRIGFVLLALAGGIGLLVYAGLWLVLIAGRTSGREWPRYLGAVVLLAILPLTLSGGSFDLMTGPVAVVLLLVGLALALWQPRLAAMAPPAYSPPAAYAARSERQAPAPPPPPRPPSILGRATLGLALVVAAVGALIDQANGGRLYPEQWLGAAAVVCGLGLLVGTIRGHARWLVVPGALFAGAGFVFAPVARLGIEFGDLVGSVHVWIDESTAGGVSEEHIGFGEVTLEVVGAPADPLTIDARVAIGELRVDVNGDDVTVEVRAHIDHGTFDTAGAAVGDVVRLGPEGEPDVIVDAHVGRGDVVVRQYNREERFVPIVPSIPELPDLPEAPFEVGPLTIVGDGVAATADGWFVLANGSAVIDADDRLVVGDTVSSESGVTFIATEFGDFQLLPRSLLITPTGEVLDLQAIRARMAPEPTEPKAPTEPAEPTVTTIPG